MALLAKVVLIGDGGVGKTSLRNDFIGKGFGTDYLPTLGSDFVSKIVHLETEDGTKELRFQIWDLAGQPSFKQIRTMYYRRAVGALLCFDVTNQGSLRNLKTWKEELIQHSGSDQIAAVVLGNKIDLRSMKEDTVSSDYAKKFIREKLRSPEFGKVEYVETSALTGKNVAKAFHTLAQRIWSDFNFSAIVVDD
ncbi:MAG: Rab family GTPase [Candidatus Heimdallarchaeota archaeon]